MSLNNVFQFQHKFIEQTPVFPKGKKLYFSKWLLTVSTNLTAESVRGYGPGALPAVQEWLRRNINHAMSVNDPEHPVCIHEEAPWWTPHPSDRVSDAHPNWYWRRSEDNGGETKSFNMTTVTEIGTQPRGGRVHTHSVIYSEHTGKLRIIYENLKWMINNYKNIHPCPVPIGNMYVHLKWIRADKAADLYLLKEHFQIT